MITDTTKSWFNKVITRYADAIPSQRSRGISDVTAAVGLNCFEINDSATGID
jgi:hypothetical protein